MNEAASKKKRLPSSKCY